MNYHSWMTSRSIFGIWNFGVEWMQTFDTLELDVTEGRGFGTKENLIPRTAAAESR